MLCESCCLEAINDVEEWYKFVQLQKLPYEKKVIETLTTLSDGKPDLFMTYLASLERKRKS